MPGTTGSTPVLCPHGVLGKKKCRTCHNEMNKRTYAERKRRIDPNWQPKHGGGAKPGLCPHGVLGMAKCRPCRIEKDRAYHAANRETRLAKQKVYSDARRAELNAKERARVARLRSDPEFQRKKADYRRANSAAIAEKSREWRAGNRERMLDNADIQRAKVRLQPGAILDRSVTLRAVIERDKGMCWMCPDGPPCYTARDVQSKARPDATSIDHLIPLIKGGDHTWENVRLAHLGCNGEKRDDTCRECNGPISNLREPVCDKCMAKGKRGKERFAVCAGCLHIEAEGPFCLHCPPGQRKQGYLATGLTRRAANALVAQERAK